MKSTRKSIFATCIITLAFLTLVSSCSKEEYRLVKVENTKGDVKVVRETEKDELEAFEGMSLISKDKVTVGESSELQLLVDSDKHLLAEQDTTFNLVATGDENKGTVKIEIIDGTALFKIDNKLNDDSSFSVSTPNAVFSVRGTEFKVSYNKSNDETTLEVTDGTVNVK